MSSLIDFAAEFFERISNPAFGSEVNDEYALRFAKLLGDDRLEQRLNDEAAQLRSTQTLTPFGWAWMLGWARTHDTQLDGGLLLRLCEEAESVAFIAAVVDTATVRADPDIQTTIVSSVHQFSDPWLRELLVRATEPRPDEPPSNAESDTERPRARYSVPADKLLMALLFVDRDVTINAAGTLLRKRWVGGDGLLEFLWSRMDELDLETRQLWEDRLGPPVRPRQTDR